MASFPTQNVTVINDISPSFFVDGLFVSPQNYPKPEQDFFFFHHIRLSLNQTPLVVK